MMPCCYILILSLPAPMNFCWKVLVARLAEQIIAVLPMLSTTVTKTPAALPADGSRGRRRSLAIALAPAQSVPGAARHEKRPHPFDRLPDKQPETFHPFPPGSFLPRPPCCGWENEVPGHHQTEALLRENVRSREAIPAGRACEYRRLLPGAYRASGPQCHRPWTRRYDVSPGDAATRPLQRAPAEPIHQVVASRMCHPA